MSFATLRDFLCQAADDCALQVLESDPYHDAVAAALNETNSWEQRRCPLKAPLVVWLVLAGVLFRAQSLASILKMVLSQYRRRLPQLSLRAVTPEAACKARKRLGHEAVAAVFRRLANNVEGTVSFHGFRVWSVDGTFLSMADTIQNEHAFGRIRASRGKTAYPQIHVTSLVDTVTREVRDVVLGRADKVDERSDAELLIGHLDGDDLLMMDCGFSAVWFFQSLMRRNIQFVARIPNCWKPKVLRTYSDGDYLVSMARDMRKARRGVLPSARLTLRMIVYQVGEDEPVRLLTSLQNERTCSASELAVLYHRRWESELVYDEQKVHLAALQHGKQKTVLRSKTPEGVRQEVYGLLTAYNLVRGLMKEAADKHDFDPRNLSFVETLRLIDLATPAYQESRSAAARAAVLRRLLDDVAETINTRPRRPRHYPRVVKIKMSNYACKKDTDCGCHRDYLAELRPVPLLTQQTPPAHHDPRPKLPSEPMLGGDAGEEPIVSLAAEEGC